MTGQDSQNRPL